MLDFASKVSGCKGTAIFSTGQAGFIIRSSKGQLLAIDLYLSNCVERYEGHRGFKRLLPQILSPSDLHFDVVIATHAHLDHFDIDAIPEMLHNGSKLLCSVGCEKLVKQTMSEYFNEQITYVRPGDKIVSGDFEMQFVNCDHGTAAPDAVGVIIKVDDRTIYEVGDSCLRLDWVHEICTPIDMLISPINGMYGNMDGNDTAILAEALNPKITVPCHYGMFASHGGDLKSFYDVMCEKKLPLLIMQQGEEYKF